MRSKATCGLFVGVLLLSTAVAFADEPDEASPEGFAYTLDAGYLGSSWTPGFRDDILTYRTEGARSYYADVTLFHGGIPFFFARHERPVEATPNQSAMFDYNQTSAAGISSFTWGFGLEVLAELFDVEHPAARWFLSARVMRRQELFFGDAVARLPFYYVERDDTVIRRDDGTILLEGGDMVDPGQTVAFSTPFHDTEISWPVSLWPFDEEDRRFDLRVGWFSSSWRKPTDEERSWVLTEDDRVIVWETIFTSQGLSLGVETRDREREGFNADVYLRGGVINNLSNEVEKTFETEGDQRLMHAQFYLNVWWRERFEIDETRFDLTIGGSYDRRLWTTKFDPVFDDRYPLFLGARGMVEADTIWKVYVRLGIGG